MRCIFQGAGSLADRLERAETLGGVFLVLKSLPTEQQQQMSAAPLLLGVFIFHELLSAAANRVLHQRGRSHTRQPALWEEQPGSSAVCGPARRK